MFLEHFGLSANPFSVDADPRFLYFGNAHREALSAVYLSIVEGGGVSVLLAASGMGKTTLLRYLFSRLDGRAAAAFFPHPYRDRRDLMSEVVSKVGLADSGGGEFEQMSRLQQRLAELKSRGYRLVLLFDEAQALSAEALEQVRLLSNLRSTNHNLLDIVLAGQSEFEEMLQAPGRDALRQRVHTVAHVEQLGAADVTEYVAHRLRIAGGDRALFDASALSLVADYSGGIPRSINRLCHKALAIAWEEDLMRVDERIIDEAARDIAGMPERSDGTGAKDTGRAIDSTVAAGSAQARGELL